ncbi:MAG TPA: TIM barrel protein [Bryobacteraceae bacterium]|nr:TIM barrel protein [Bryobacteraceae bacterium]
MTRRTALQTLAATMAAGQTPSRTEFQIACMTIPFQQFSFERGVKGVAAAGFRYIAWGPHQADSSKRRLDTIALDSGPGRARELLRITRDAGLEAVLMFASFYPENPGAVDAYKKRIDQAQAAGIPNLLTFGSPKSTAEHRDAYLRTLREIAGHARQAKVAIAVKQHGGLTANGALTAAIVREVNHPAVVAFYDAGNTWWYNNADANSDFAKCASMIRGFAIKDFREYGGQRATCGAGFGQTDHYAMLGAVANHGGPIPLCCENLAEPFVTRPESVEGIETLARRSREYLDTVVRGVTAPRKG